MQGQNLNHESDLFSKILNMALIITRCYIDGHTSLKIIFELLEIQNHKIDSFFSAQEFFNFLYGISYQSAMINLSNILVKNKESVEIHYFQSCFSEYVKELPNPQNYESVKDAVKKIIDNYPINGNFYLGLKELRDKYIVHIDKAKFNSYSEPNNKIKLEEVKNAYDCIGNLIGAFFSSMGINPELVDFEQLDKANLQFRLLINGVEPNPLI